MRILAVTPGDPNGIGPEITWKVLRGKLYDAKKIALLCVGAREPFDRLGVKVIEANLAGPLEYPQSSKPFVWLLPAPTHAPKNHFLPGFQTGWSIEVATRLVLKRHAEAIVTGPIHKERLQRGGYHYPGHTEFLAKLCKGKAGVPKVTMMLANEQLKITLATTHLALKDVSRKLTREKLTRTITQTVEHLQKWWGISHPKIAIAALNPHAGEHGLFGREEILTITPTIEALKKHFGKTCTLTGPLPADTLFAKHMMAPKTDRFDAVVCMYHDQGLIPVKLVDFPRTVNITLGLPIVRTSVDHGVGFDIAGKNIADPSSLASAIQLATKILNRRKV